MADLKYLGFVLALASYADSWFDTAVEVYSTGRKFLPEVADTVVQSAEDVSVTLFLFFVAPIVSKTRKTASSLLEWTDEKLDERAIVVVEFYETAMSDVASFITQLKDTHREQLKDFLAAREAVNNEFKNMADVLREKGVLGGVMYILGTLQECLWCGFTVLQLPVQKVLEIGLFAALVRCWDIWFEACYIAVNNQFVLKIRGQLLALIATGIESFMVLPRILYTAAGKILMSFQALWDTAIDKFDGLIDYVVASPTYIKVVDMLHGAIAWIWSFALVQKICAVILPYAMPLVELIEGNQLLHDIVERLTPNKRD